MTQATCDRRHAGARRAAPALAVRHALAACGNPALASDQAATGPGNQKNSKQPGAARGRLGDSPASTGTAGTAMPQHTAYAPPAWWARALIALGFLGLLAVDPLNAGSASGQRSEQAVLRVASPFYVASGEVTVILIDDAFLRRIGSGWPMAYREQGLLLRRILAHEPAAVFVDLLYRHRHAREPAAGAAARPDGPTSDPTAPESDEPGDLLLPLPGATDQPIPVLFATLPVESLAAESPVLCTRSLPAAGLSDAPLADAASIEPSLRAPFGLAASAPVAAGSGPQPGTALVSWSGCGTAYPLLLAASRRGATPAMALFDATCRRRPEMPACQFGGKAPLDVAERFVAPMTVRWGAFAPGVQAPFYAEGVCQRMTDVEGRVPALTRALRSLQQLALGALFDLRDRRDPDLALPCPAVPVLRADAILDGDAAAVESLLRGRAVLLGAQISGIPDWQPSPVHGRVPGVVLHAMALDNLLVRGDRYLRPLPSGVSRGVMLALAFAAAVLAPWVVARKPYFREATRAGAGQVLWAAYAAVLAAHGHWSQSAAVLGVAIAFDLIKPTDTFRYALLFLVMAVLANLALAFGRTPWNWIGLVFVVLATTETLKAYLKGGPPKRFPHDASLCRRAWSAWRARPIATLPTGSAP